MKSPPAKVPRAREGQHMVSSLAGSSARRVVVSYCLDGLSYAMNHHLIVKQNAVASAATNSATSQDGRSSGGPSYRLLSAAARYKLTTTPGIASHTGLPLGRADNVLNSLGGFQFCS